MKMQEQRNDNGSETQTSGCDHGTMFPPLVTPKRNKTKVDIRRDEPRKSTRESDDRFLSIVRGVLDLMALNWQPMMTKEATVSGVCARNEILQFQVSFI